MYAGLLLSSSSRQTALSRSRGQLHLSFPLHLCTQGPAQEHLVVPALMKHHHCPAIDSHRSCECPEARNFSCDPATNLARATGCKDHILQVPLPSPSSTKHKFLRRASGQERRAGESGLARLGRRAAPLQSTPARAVSRQSLQSQTQGRLCRTVVVTLINVARSGEKGSHGTECSRTEPASAGTGACTTRLRVKPNQKN